MGEAQNYDSEDFEAAPRDGSGLAVRTRHGF